MADNRIAFGLCKQHNITLPKGATPHDAWEALKENNIVAGDDSSAKSSSIIPNKGKSYSAPNKCTLTQKEWAIWYKFLGDERHGDYVFTCDGKKYIQIGNKIIISSGTFKKPKVEYVLAYENEAEATEEYMLIRKVYGGM